MPNFSSLAGLEVAEKFVRGVVGWGGVEHVTTVSNSNASWVELSWVALGFDKFGAFELLSRKLGRDSESFAGLEIFPVCYGMLN